MPDYFLLGLLGHPLSNSLSPALHTAALNFAGLKGEYRLMDIAPENFGNEWPKILNTGLAGFNITIPYKQDIFALVSKLSPEAQLVGAINTVKTEDGKLIGHNTDLLGFTQSYIDAFGDSLKNQTALVIGAGGSAKAVIIGLIQMGVNKILITGRDQEKVNKFIDEMKNNLNLTNDSNNSIFLTYIDQNKIQTNSHEIATIINATPIGLTSQTIPDWFNKLTTNVSPQCTFFNLVYRKDGTKPALTQLANTKKLKTVDGLPMLIHQAKYAFAYWTKVNVPFEAMYKGLPFAR